MSGHFADLRKLPAVKEHMTNRHLRLSKKRTGKVRPQGGRRQQCKLRNLLLSPVTPIA